LGRCQLLTGATQLVVAGGGGGGAHEVGQHGWQHGWQLGAHAGAAGARCSHHLSHHEQQPRLATRDTSPAANQKRLLGMPLSPP